MKNVRHGLLSTAAVIPLALGVAAGVAVVGSVATGGMGSAVAACNPCNPCAAKKACNPCNPCAAAKACNPCNPCGAKKACNPCNPCGAAKACNPCNPCAASACNPCNPCNPCAAGGGSVSKSCFVPRLQAAAACNPCAAKACNPCNPCNPCGAKKACNPCNPCSAAKACNPCNPCGAKKACNPCNPCGAAKACNPCNPCSAATACNPCNPCAAKKACNPCAAAACNPCNPCNPCAAAAEVELTAEELKAVYDCLKPELVKAYGKAPALAAKRWGKWERFSSVSYRSDTHGGRLVNNYSNSIGKKAYGQYDAVKRMPIGSTLAKDSFVVNANGTVALGPLFLMEKMTRGFNKATADWRYAMVMPNGTLFGITGGKNAAGLKFCHDCHIAAEDNDMMLFLPEEYRKK